MARNGREKKRREAKEREGKNITESLLFAKKVPRFLHIKNPYNNSFR